MTDQKNTILAIVLSALVLIGWQIMLGIPQMEKQRQIQQQQQQAQERATIQVLRRSARRDPTAGTRLRRPYGSDAAGARPCRAAPGQDPDPGTAAGGIAAVRIETPSSRRLDRTRRVPGSTTSRSSNTARPSTPSSPPIVLLGAVGQPAPVLFRIRLGRAPSGNSG